MFAQITLLFGLVRTDWTLKGCFLAALVALVSRKVLLVLVSSPTQHAAKPLLASGLQFNQVKITPFFSCKHITQKFQKVCYIIIVFQTQIELNVLFYKKSDGSAKLLDICDDDHKLTLLCGRMDVKKSMSSKKS